MRSALTGSFLLLLIILFSEAGSFAQAPPPPVKISILTYSYENKGKIVDVDSKLLKSFQLPPDANAKEIIVKMLVDPKGPAIVGLYLQEYDQKDNPVGQELKMPSPTCLDPETQTLWKTTIPAGTMPPSTIWKVMARVNRAGAPKNEDYDFLLISTTP